MKTKKRDAEASPEPVSADAPATKTNKRSKLPPLPSTPVGTRYEVSMRPKSKPDDCITIMSWNVAGVWPMIVLSGSEIVVDISWQELPGCAHIQRSVAGLRALVKKEPDAIERLLSLENVDVLCLQEHKLQEKHVEDLEAQVLIDGWAACWSCSVKPGYAGTCILYRKEAFGGAEPTMACGIGCEKHDQEGRIVTLSVPEFHICNVYVPNSGTNPFPATFGSFNVHVCWIQASHCDEPPAPGLLSCDLCCRGWLEAPGL